MAERIVKNTRQNVLVLFTSNSTLTVAGNATASNVGLSTVTDDITGVSIKQVWAGSISGGSGFWEVKRGSNTVMMLDSTLYWDLAGVGCSITLDPGATVVVERTGGSGTLMIEFQKIYATSGSETATSTY